MIKRLIVLLLLVYVGYYCYYPNRHAKHYTYVNDAEIFGELVQENLADKQTNLQICKYNETIIRNIEYEAPNKLVHYDYEKPKIGGQFVPTCRPLFKTAVLVPYRNRKAHLDIFLNYMHYFLQKQHIVYRIFIVEQNNSLEFNRAKMLNVGATEAMKLGFNCLILHDVDILPLNGGNLYACSKKPRHMSSCLDTFRFNLPYLGLFGGVISITSKQFRDINGMSNVYDGWGGEDDDLFTRLEAANYLPYRFSPQISKYTMLMHKKEKPSEERYNRLNSALQRQKVDGLNNLPKNYSVKLESLYTHLFV